MAYPGTYDRVINLIKNLDRNIKIIELGCGKGNIVERLKALGFNNVTYCDIKDQFDGKVKLMDFNKKLKFKSNSFNLAISTEVIEHLENKYFFFREVKRILKKNGHFIFSSPNIFNIANRIIYFLRGRFIEFNEKEFPHHINPFFIWELPQFFNVEKITYNRGFIPLLRIPFVRNSLFGQTIIMGCKIKK